MSSMGCWTRTPCDSCVSIRRPPTGTPQLSSPSATCWAALLMPRLRALKDQQLARVDRASASGVCTPWLTTTVDLGMVEEQWGARRRVALARKQRTAPAHVIVQRLTHSLPAARLSKAVTTWGRLIKTPDLLRYLTARALRRTGQLQLHQGAYRHQCPRRMFFANQGEFTSGD